MDADLLETWNAKSNPFVIIILTAAQIELILYESKIKKKKTELGNITFT